jgi:hypothetical protein
MLSPSSGLKIAFFSETLASTYESTRRHHPEEQHRHTAMRTSNLKEKALSLPRQPAGSDCTVSAGGNLLCVYEFHILRINFVRYFLLYF